MNKTVRLASAYLEDLATIAITTPPEAETLSLYPDLDVAIRTKLRARLKQLGRHDWPTSMKEDPELRQGYTLRQCFRLISALALVNAQLRPGIAVAIAASNELEIMRVILDAIETGKVPAKNDRIAVCATGDLCELIDEHGFMRTEPNRLRWLQRHTLAELWSAQDDLAHPGPRVVIDIGQMGRAAWRWISERRLIPGDELQALAREIEVQQAEPGYRPGINRTNRR
ncbi:MAG: hypothetical protein V7676_05510 [Parasphingorhabdus sp.]|uniref:hypothetical protein n=1 Tax=Parasphingorhabdus sp. TaxID=2709688 RepID=UPI0030035175